MAVFCCSLPDIRIFSGRCFVAHVRKPGFFRIHADSRDLNYDNYFSKGNAELSQIEPYTSHNTQRLDLDGMKRLLQKLKLFGGNC